MNACLLMHGGPLCTAHRVSWPCHSPQAGLIEEMIDDTMEEMEPEDLDDLADEEVKNVVSELLGEKFIGAVSFQYVFPPVNLPALGLPLFHDPPFDQACMSMCPCHAKLKTHTHTHTHTHARTHAHTHTHTHTHTCLQSTAGLAAPVLPDAQVQVPAASAAETDLEKRLKAL